MIKAIFLDIGGVLILSNRKEILEKWVAKLNVQPEYLRTTLKQFSDLKMTGRDLSYEDFINENRIVWMTGGQLEDLQKALWNTECVNKKLLDFILENKGKYVFGIISNNYKEAEEVVLNKYKIPKFYDIFVSSYDLGILKPNKEIYELALKKINLPANQCLFIDDSGENVEGAEKVGMTGLQYEDNETFFEKFKTALK